MSRKRKTRTRAPKKQKDHGLVLSKLGVEEKDHDAFKEAAKEAARAGVDDFPKTLQLIKDQFRKHDPKGILAAFSSYGMRAYVGSDGVTAQSGLTDIQQYHGELLQALFLTIPTDDWGVEMLTPDVMQTVFDAMPKLSNISLFQSILSTPDTLDEQELVVRSLQQRVRFHTQGVRNWGYFSEVVRLSKLLVGPLDADLMSHHGFSGTDMIEILHAVVKEYEKRQNEHWSTLQKVVRGKNVRQIVRQYYKHVPNLKGSSEEMIASLPRGISRRQIIGMLMAHFDLRLAEKATFQVDDVAELVGCNPEVVKAVLKATSLVPGSLTAANPEHLFLNNPVWDRPAIELSDSFFIPIPQQVFSHINRVMDRIANEAGLKARLHDRRADFLERQLEETIKKVLPSADIKSGVKWKVEGQQFETDLLVIIDRVVLIAEAKSNRMTPEGLRGAPDRVKRHIEDMVLNPSLQSERLERLIEVARKGDKDASAIMRGIGIDPTVVDRVIRISVTLDDLSVLSTAEADFKKVGWIPANHQLVPTVLLADLICLADILDNPLLLLHYLSERYHFQKSFDLLGDELDFLGLYLVSGFNLAELSSEDMTFAPSGMSEPIDRHYMSRDEGISIPKPTMELRPLFRDIVNRLSDRQPHGWTTIGMHLLSSADPGEQRVIKRSLLKLRKMVRKNYKDPQHVCSLQVQPPEKRKARITFHLFPEQLRCKQKEVMTQLAADALDSSGIDICVVFSRSTETFDRPYEAVCIVG